MLKSPLTRSRLAEDYSLELQYRKPFKEVWKELQSHQVLGPLSERMGVRDRANGRLLVNDEELEGSGKSF